MEPVSTAIPTDTRSPFGRLLVMIGTRGLDQFALGAATLLIAHRVGTIAFAPFASIFILYALTAQIGDGGLALAVLRTPAGGRIDLRARQRRLAISVVLATIGAGVGTVVGGSTGIVVAVGAATLLSGPLVFVGRAALQWSQDTRRLAVAEGSGAVFFLLTVSLFVRDPDDLLLLGVLCIAKQLIEFVLQGPMPAIFDRSGDPVRAMGLWVSQAVNYSAANVDYLIVGWMLGAEALSIYAIGFRLASAFSSVVAAPLTRTAFVAFANTSDAQKQHDRLTRQIFGFGVLGVASVSAIALLLPVVLGSEWAAAREVTLLLGLALPWRLLLGPVVALGMTSGRVGKVIGWELVRMVVLASAIVVGSSSIATVAAAVSAATVLSIGWAYRRATTGVGIAQSRSIEGWGFAVAVAVVAVSLI